MIVLLVMAVVLFRLFILCAETCFERDWPRHTIRGFLIALGLLWMCCSAFGQAVYISQPLQTYGPNVPTSGGPMPQTLWVSNATVNICTHPSSTLAACLASPVVTYT